MEAQPIGNSVSGHQDLKTELIEMLKGVVPPEMSGVHEQCIYKVPPGIRKANPEAYTPHIVSIGPFHNPHGSGRRENNILQPMEELKLKYVKGFLNRTNLCVEDFVFKLKEWEPRIRSCYAGPVSDDSNDFLKMIMTDACFIIEHFLRDFRSKNWENKDPILLKPGLFNDIERDLVLIENQLPFFVLEDIYKLAGLNLEFHPFVTVTIYYFHRFNMQNINSERVRPKHFTDLLRTFMLPSSFDHVEQEEEGDKIGHVYRASQLSEAGLLFEVSEDNNCLLDLKFDKGVLTMPCFHVHDTTETYLRNILTFEKCHDFPYSTHITQHFWILTLLIKTEKDVSILVDKNIIVNYMGDANSVVTMFNNLCKNIEPPRFNSKYPSLCDSLNGFYENPRNKYKAIFIPEYFDTPVKIASSIAAMLLLLLTLIQTIFSVCSYFKE